MFAPLKARLRQGYHTNQYPEVVPALSERYMGLPQVDASRCEAACAACSDACPVDAIERIGGLIALDLGKCLFCGECARLCPHQAIQFSPEHRMARFNRQALIAGNQAQQDEPGDRTLEIQRLFGRSLRLRQVSAGGCNACEADTNVLGTLAFDLGRFGIQFVASPRHADGILVTGPVTKNMELALRKTYDAVPDPKVVIAVGACAVSGGLYAGHPEVSTGLDGIIPVDLYVPGCPPHPLTILDGLLKLISRAP